MRHRALSDHLVNLRNQFCCVAGRLWFYSLSNCHQHLFDRRNVLLRIVYERWINRFVNCNAGVTHKLKIAVTSDTLQILLFYAITFGVKKQLAHKTSDLVMQIIWGAFIE